MRCCSWRLPITPPPTPPVISDPGAGDDAQPQGYRLDPPPLGAAAAAFSYDEAFSRNIGWITEWEQQSLRRKRVAIAGMGGVGGVHLLTLTRLGIGAFFCPTGYGTLLTAGRETRRIDGRDYVLEYPIHADYALIKAHKADRWGNLVYRKTARNFGPVMAMAAKTTVVEVDEVVELGALDPESIVTPGIFVHHVVRVSRASVKAA